MPCKRQDLTERLTDAVKLVAAQHLRDEARAAAYFQVGLLQAPPPVARPPPPSPPSLPHDESRLGLQ